MTLEELASKLELWKGAWPKLTETALKTGTDLLRDEIKRRWLGQVLSPLTGKLVRAVKSTVKMNPISAKVEVEQKQQYKAQTHEYGKTIDASMGRRGQLRTSKTGKAAFLQLGPPGAAYWGRPKIVNIPARPVFHEAKQAMMKQILNKIEKTIIEGYKKA